MQTATMPVARPTSFARFLSLAAVAVAMLLSFIALAAATVFGRIMYELGRDFGMVVTGLELRVMRVGNWLAGRDSPYAFSWWIPIAVALAVFFAGLMTLAWRGTRTPIVMVACIVLILLGSMATGAVLIANTTLTLRTTSAMQGR
jgi:hypothetical protein